jgi:hypothetical protein
MEICGRLHAPAALPPRNAALVPIRQEAGWAPEPFWPRWWREKFPALAGIIIIIRQIKQSTVLALQTMNNICTKHSSNFRFPAGAGNFSVHHSVQNGSGAQPASYPMGTRGSFPGGKAAGAWSWSLTSISAEVKNVWSYISTPPVRLHGAVLS